MFGEHAAMCMPLLIVLFILFLVIIFLLILLFFKNCRDDYHYPLSSVTNKALAA